MKFATIVFKVGCLFSAGGLFQAGFKRVNDQVGDALAFMVLSLVLVLLPFVVVLRETKTRED